MLRLLPSSTALGHKVSDEVYLCKLFWGRNITYMAAPTGAFFLCYKSFSVNITLPVESRRDVERGRIQLCSEVNNRRASEEEVGARAGRREEDKRQGRLEPPQGEGEGRGGRGRLVSLR